MKGLQQRTTLAQVQRKPLNLGLITNYLEWRQEAWSKDPDTIRSGVFCHLKAKASTNVTEVDACSFVVLDHCSELGVSAQYVEKQDIPWCI